MSKPVVDFQVLRHIAESASGLRYQDTWFVVSEDPVFGKTINFQHTEPEETPDTVVIQSQKVEYGQPPQVGYARIGTGTGEEGSIDLLNVSVARSEAQMDPAIAHGRADAAFWSLSAVEKFLTPYYASVYGDTGGRMVQAVLDVLRPQAAAEMEQDGAADRTQAFAVIHLPNSEYVGVDEPEALATLFSLHESGDVRRIRVRPRGGYGPDDAPQNVGSRER